MAVKYLSVREFRELGVLQEINRRLLHPAGLALEVMVSADGGGQISGVWDFRDDPEGVVFADLSKSENREKAVTVDGFKEAHFTTREEKFGWVVLPIGSVVLMELPPKAGEGTPSGSCPD
jgi:hypothetical protein